MSKKLTEYVVAIPDEVYTIIDFESDGRPGVAVVNSALVDFEPKVVFDWHLSVIVDCNNVGKNGMPSSEEQKVLYQIEDLLDPLIKDDGNALFLARITQNGTRQLLWRVCEPKLANQALQKLINGNLVVREFEYLVEEDPAWEFAAPYLDFVRRERSSQCGDDKLGDGGAKTRA